jgi:alkylation response protein AidB-like acyl-CoA dehydrogenase
VDFDLSTDQQALADLADQIFGDLASADRVAEVEATDDRFDRSLWEALAEAGLVGVALPERDGGLGLGMVEACLVLEQQGRRVAPVPLLAVTALGAWAIAAHGSDAQRARWLEGVTQGSRILTGAWTDPAGADHSQPLAGVADRYPDLASVCVVPLGVSRYTGEARMRPHTVAEAGAVLDWFAEGFSYHGAYEGTS